MYFTSLGEHVPPILKKKDNREELSEEIPEFIPETNRL